MKYIIHNLWILLFLLGLLSCSQEENLDRSDKVGIQVALAAESSVSIVSRSSTPVNQDAYKEFDLQITKQTSGEIIFNGKCPTTVIPVFNGIYDVAVSRGEDALIGRSPYYKGETEVEVNDNLANADVTCTLGNALVSAVFPEDSEMKKMFSSYAIKVVVREDALNITTAEDEKKVYFRANVPVSFYFEAEKLNGSKISEKLDHEDLPNTFKAAQHCILHLAFDSDLTVDVTKAEVVTETIEEIIPVEWLPSPKVSSTGFDDNNSLSLYETQGITNNVSIDFKVASALQELKFTLNLSDESLASYNKEYVLSEMNDNDIAHLKLLGINLPAIGSSENVKMELTPQFVNSLKAKNEGVANNVITITDVMANYRHLGTSVSDPSIPQPVSYTIAVEKPEFTISVQPGNVWTKEFTVDPCVVTEGKGNLETIKKDLVFQYREDQNEAEWKNCSDGLIQKFTDVPEVKSYKVRALYDDRLTSNVIDIMLETPDQVPNGNMDEWSDITLEIKYYLNKYNQPCFLPWSESNASWWDTNNYESMPSNLPSVGNENYKCFPTSTYLVPGRGNTGCAAVLRTINADGFTSWSNAAAGTNFRGVLFSGYTDRDGTMHEGRAFNSRPTKMMFYCKYDSYDNERFGAYVKLYNGENLVASGEYISERKSINDFISIEIPITFIQNSIKATSIQIKFCSVALGDTPAVQKNVSVNVPEGSDKRYNVHAGSKLTIDDITLIYDR